jgi:hypothetical protein
MTSEEWTKVWLVWTEQGEYEQYSRDLRGVFVSKELAEGHAEALVDGEVAGAWLTKAQALKEER